MSRTARWSSLTVALTATLVTAAAGLAPSASAGPNEAYLKVVHNCASVGPVTLNINGPGLEVSTRHETNTGHFKGRGGIYQVERLSNGKIAPKKAFLDVRAGTTRTILVCNSSWA